MKKILKKILDCYYNLIITQEDIDKINKIEKEKKRLAINKKKLKNEIRLATIALKEINYL